MPKHRFTAHLDRQPTDDELDLLYEAGFDDSAPVLANGSGEIWVTREAPTLAAAIVSVVADAERAGFQVVALEDEDIVSLKTVAQRVGRTYESVRLLAHGRRGPGGFPPVTGDRWALVSWTAAARWFRQYDGTDVTSTERDRIIAAADHLLRARALDVNLVELAPLTLGRDLPHVADEDRGENVSDSALATETPPAAA